MADLSTTVAWQDLSDGELRSRLINRGLKPEIAALWVQHRDKADFALTIGQTLTSKKRLWHA